MKPTPNPFQRLRWIGRGILLLPLFAYMLLLLYLPPAGSFFFQFFMALSCLAAWIMKHHTPVSFLERATASTFNAQPVWTKSALTAFLAGASLMILILGLLSANEPYYFTKDDNFTQFLPVVIQAMRGFFEQGIFPTWNGYQMLGVPTASLGYYGLTYPPLYACYAVARYLCGNELLTFELLIWLHLLASYCFCFIAMRCLGLRASLAVTGAFGCVMTGYNIMCGACWFYSATSLAGFSAMVLSLIMFMRGPVRLKWIIGSALAIGLSFHSGNVQLWCYAMLFWGLGIMWTLACLIANPRPRPGAFAAVCAAVLGGLALSAPLLLIQSIETASIPRLPWDVNTSWSLNRFFLPLRYDWFRIMPIASIFGQAFYFSGGIFAFGFFLRFALDAACISKGWRSLDGRMTLCFSFIALFALTLSIGDRGGIWILLNSVPPFSRFRMPFKLVPFVVFFFTLSGGCMVEKALRFLGPRGRLLGPAVAVVSMGLMAFTACSYDEHFFVWADKAYPALSPAQEALQAKGFTTKGRIFSGMAFVPQIPGYTKILALNFPTLYSIPAATGYDLAANLETGLTENIQAANLFRFNPIVFNQQFGVKWVMTPDLAKRMPLAMQNLMVNSFNGITLPNFPNADLLRKQGFAEKDFGILHGFDMGKDVKPMAYIQSFPPKPLEYKIEANGVEIKIPPARPIIGPTSRILVANFLYRHWLQASLNQETLQSLHPDAYGRIALQLPDSGGILSIRYMPPWSYGIALGLVLAALALPFGGFFYYRRIAVS